MHFINGLTSSSAEGNLAVHVTPSSGLGSTGTSLHVTSVTRSRPCPNVVQVAVTTNPKYAVEGTLTETRVFFCRILTPIQTMDTTIGTLLGSITIHYTD